MIGYLGQHGDRVANANKITGHFVGAGLGRADLGGEILGQVQDAHARSGIGGLISEQLFIQRNQFLQ